MKQQILVIVPHPDDEVLGFGGSISKHIQQGNNVTVIYTTVLDYIDSRYLSQMQTIPLVAKKLGFTFAEMNIKAKEMFAHNALVTLFEDRISSIKPDILYLPHPNDTHQDHENLYNVIRIATRVNGKAFVKKILCGEIISSTHTSILKKTPFRPNYYESLKEEDINIKIECLSKYKNEIREFPHSRSEQGIKAYANVRGMESGTEWAEAFEVMRWFN